MTLLPSPQLTKTHLPSLSPLLPHSQWGAKALDAKAACVAVYDAARPVLAAIHDAPLQ